MKKVQLEGLKIGDVVNGETAKEIILKNGKVCREDNSDMVYYLENGIIVYEEKVKGLIHQINDFTTEYNWYKNSTYIILDLGNIEEKLPEEIEEHSIRITPHNHRKWTEMDLKTYIVDIEDNCWGLIHLNLKQTIFVRDILNKIIDIAENLSQIKVGDKVKIVEGIFEYLEGEVVNVDNSQDNPLKIKLDSTDTIVDCTIQCCLDEVEKINN